MQVPALAPFLAPRSSCAAAEYVDRVHRRTERSANRRHCQDALVHHHRDRACAVQFCAPRSAAVDCYSECMSLSSVCLISPAPRAHDKLPRLGVCSLAMTTSHIYFYSIPPLCMSMAPAPDAGLAVFHQQARESVLARRRLAVAHACRHDDGARAPRQVARRQRCRRAQRRGGGMRVRAE